MQFCEDVFKSYEEASGQMINLDKSSFMVSRNVSNENSRKIGETLGIKKENSLGTYLGMPSQSERKKSNLFEKIRSKTGNILQGWSERLFSAGGKETLIKSVIQAIPTYNMSCFKLPKGLCDKINNMCSKFWWRDVNDRKKIHWANWKKL